MIGAIGSVGRVGLQARRPTGRLLLYPAYVQDYLDRVTAADVSAGNTQGLELGVTDAFNTTLQATVGDGSLGVSNNVLAQAASLIKASCFMQGARTLSGALVPLAADMPAPTNINFVAGDYSRKTGIAGDASGKYLDTNYNNNLNAQNDRHAGVFATAKATVSGRSLFGSTSATAGRARASASGTNDLVTNCGDSTNATTAGGYASGVGYIGVSRDASSSYVLRASSVATTISVSSTSPASAPTYVFSNASGSTWTNARLAFYSIGKSLDLTILDARITALSNAIQAAIP